MNSSSIVPGFQLRPVGDRSLLIEVAGLRESALVHSVLREARSQHLIDVDELVPAAKTVLVTGRITGDLDKFSMLLADLLTQPGLRAAASAPFDTVTIPVVYDGEDLAEVARLTGLSEREVIERHTAAEYSVAFTGFAPGFAYLAGGDPALHVPRRSTPRPRVGRGAVGLAGEFSGVYPRESPGGWQLLGHTTSEMWDLEREVPALLQPGMTVRFTEATEPEQASVAHARNASAAHSRAATLPGSETLSGDLTGGSHRGAADTTGALTVVEPGLLTLVQDSGRAGLATMGVSPSGAADRSAFREANRLVGNDRDAAVLELGAGSFVADVNATAVAALTGAPRTGHISGPYGSRQVPYGEAFRVSDGERLTLQPPSSGVRSTLAIRGGITAPLTLGSAARDSLSGLGPEPIAAGDTISSGAATGLAVGIPRPQHYSLPAVGEETVLRVIPGPRDDWFGDGIETLWNQAWLVTPRSDRVGVRLSGTPIERTPEHVSQELMSEGTVTGALQIPPDGNPVLFLTDRPLTGGYPVIGVVADADLDLAAQLPPGSYVRFEPTCRDRCACSAHEQL